VGHAATRMRPRVIVVVRAAGAGGGVAFARRKMRKTKKPFRDRNCDDFATQDEAQRFYEANRPGTDPHRLDTHRNGIACALLP
jgi:hypothetical protein